MPDAVDHSDAHARDAHARDAGSRELAGLVAVVTGSSSGIGAAIALALAGRGAACVVHARRSAAAAQRVAAAIGAGGGDAAVMLADVSSPAERERLVADAWRWRGRVDVWINNAGADILTGPAAKGSFEEKLETLWRVDVGGTIGLARAAGGRMFAAGGGAIINIGWDQAECGLAGPSGELFAAAKGAIMAFSKSLARSLAPKVRVNCIAPGWIRTAWGENASDYWDRRARAESLLDRWGTPGDVAAAACYLASPGLFLTGSVLPANGGFRGAFAESPPDAALQPNAAAQSDAAATPDMGAKPDAAAQRGAL